MPDDNIDPAVYSDENSRPSVADDPEELSAAEAERNLVETYQSAVRRETADPDYSIEMDRRWYDRAHDQSETYAKRNGTDPVDFHRIVAILSPQMRWNATVGGEEKFPNLETAHVVAQVHRENPEVEVADIVSHENYHGALPLSLTKALTYLRTKDPAVVSGPKVESFVQNLSDPAGSRGVTTIDTILAQVMMGRPLTAETKPLARKLTAERAGQRRGGYGWSQRRVREAARAVGETPQSFQSIAWAEWRRLHP